MPCCVFPPSSPPNLQAVKTSVNYTCCFVCRETLDSKDTSRVIMHVVRPVRARA